jgi:hypothetical protein
MQAEGQQGGIFRYWPRETVEGNPLVRNDEVPRFGVMIEPTATINSPENSPS